MSDPTRRNIRLTVLATVLFSLLAVAGLINKLSSPRILNEYQLRSAGAIVLPTARAVADMALVDHRGQAFTAAQLKGKWSLVFFGFSHCGDICPTTLATMAKMYGELKDDEKQALQILLVTVDPARDTPAVLAKYVAGFNADFIGVTGAPPALANFASDLALAYSPVAAGEDDDQVAHAVNLALIDPAGNLIGYLRPPHEHGSLRVVWRSLRATHKSAAP